MVDIFCGEVVTLLGRFTTACDPFGAEAGGIDGETVAGADVYFGTIPLGGLAWDVGEGLVSITRRYDFIGEWQI